MSEKEPKKHNCFRDKQGRGASPSRDVRRRKRGSSPGDTDHEQPLRQFCCCSSAALRAPRRLAGGPSAASAFTLGLRTQSSFGHNGTGQLSSTHSVPYSPRATSSTPMASSSCDCQRCHLQPPLNFRLVLLAACWASLE